MDKKEDKNNKSQTTRIAALGDIHVGRADIGSYASLFAEISEKADVLVLCGDLTNIGSPAQAEILAQDLTSCRIPIVGVLGNHDYAEGRQDEVKKILNQAQMTMLDDEPTIIHGIGFAGVKGFGGGFDNHMLGPFGEEMTKAYAREAVEEALHLENELGELRTEKKVVAMHYSPIRDTVINEPEEIFPFLGSSRFVEPIELNNVSVVFHGHAHKGTHKGKTLKGIPVYNVAFPLMQQINEKQPYALIEL